MLAVLLVLGGLAQRADAPYMLDEKRDLFGHKQTSAFLYAIIVAFLIFVAGFRYYVGADFYAYYGHYDYYVRSLGESLRTLTEPGYPLIARLGTLIYDDGASAIFAASFFTIGLSLLVVYRHSERLLPALVLYLFLGFWDGSFNGVRQYMAVAVVFCGYSALREKKFWKYLLIIFVAYLCHRSAAVMIILYFLVHREINFRNLFVLIIVVVVGLTIYDRLFSFAGWILDDEAFGGTQYATNQVNRLRVLASVLPTMLFIALCWKQEKNERETFFLNLMILHTAIQITTMNSALLYRIGDYTTLFQVVAIPEVLKMLSRRNRSFINSFMYPLYGVLWWYEIYIHEDLNNFRWIWQR